MPPDLYSARIGECKSLAEDIPYEDLVDRIMEFTVRAAMARSRDDADWEQDELRRSGLACLQLFRNGKAIWSDPETFRTERDEAIREQVEDRFNARNELDPELNRRLDRDVRERWRSVGYNVPRVMLCMKELFNELERDLADRANRAMERLMNDVLNARSTPSSPKGEER